jgi:hypothetical protein
VFYIVWVAARSVAVVIIVWVSSESVVVSSVVSSVVVASVGASVPVVVASVCASIGANSAVDMLGLPATLARKLEASDSESCVCGTVPEASLFESLIRLRQVWVVARSVWVAARSVEICLGSRQAREPEAPGSC